MTEYQFRYDLDDSTAEAERSHSYFSTSLTLYLLRDADEKQAVGIGASYVRGEDPSRRFERQEYTQIGLKVCL